MPGVILTSDILLVLFQRTSFELSQIFDPRILPENLSGLILKNLLVVSNDFYSKISLRVPTKISVDFPINFFLQFLRHSPWSFSQNSFWNVHKNLSFFPFLEIFPGNSLRIVRINFKIFFSEFLSGFRLRIRHFSRNSFVLYHAILKKKKEFFIILIS